MDELRQYDFTSRIKIPAFFKVHLDRCEDLKHDLRRNINKRKKLHELGDFPKKADYKLFVDGTHGSKVENFALAILELEEAALDLQNQINACLKEMETIVKRIDRKICQMVLEERLIYKKSWAQICDESFYTRGYLDRVFKDGIALLEKLET
jgi:hypothetical protein